VGSYAINGSGLTALNYVFMQNPRNATALTITQATLSYTATPVARAVNFPNPPFSGTVTGFLNGDTLASATTGTLVFTSAATIDSPIGKYAIDGSGLNAANYTFIQAPGNATALTVGITPPPLLLASFTNSIQPPMFPSGLLQLDLIALTAALAPPPPPPPSQPPSDDPLADLSDTPNSSDQTTSEVAASLDGGGVGAHNVVVIQSLLVSTPPPPNAPTDPSELPSFGNSSLWQ
jgi:hypothetical protein